MAGENDSNVLDVVIVGGGIAGLATGYRLRDREILLLEKEDICGGRTISRQLGPYIYNAGAQVILGGSSRVGQLADELGVKYTLIAKSRLPFFFNGRLVSSPSRLGLLWKLPMFLGDRLRLAWALFSLRRKYGSLTGTPFDPKDPKRIELNSQTLAEFIGPVPRDIRAFWDVMAVDSTTADADIVTPNHPLMVLLGFLEEEYFVEGGTGHLTATLHDRIATKTETGAEVVKVMESDDILEVTYDKGGVRKSVKARHCVMATPAPVTLKAVQELPSWKRDALARIEYGSMTTAAFLLNQPSERFLGRGVWRVPVQGQKACAVTDPTFTFPREMKEQAGQGLLRVYTSDAVSKELMKLFDGEVAEALMEDLISMIPSVKGEVVQTDVAHWFYALPLWKPGHLELFESLQAPTGRIHYCGDYTGPGFMEGSVASAYRVVEEIGSE